MRSIVAVIASASLGLAAGAGAIVSLSHDRPRPPLTTATLDEVERSAPQNAQTTTELADTPLTSQVTVAAATGTQFITNPYESPQDQYQRVAAKHNDALAAHQREARDSTWAQMAESSFRGDFAGPIAAGKFNVVNVDCRTSTCLVDLEFSDFSAAHKNWKEAAGRHAAGNCSVDVLFDDPNRPHSGVVHGSALYQCVP